jgi:hypothetical protein
MAEEQQSSLSNGDRPLQQSALIKFYNSLSFCEEYPLIYAERKKFKSKYLTKYTEALSNIRTSSQTFIISWVGCPSAIITGARTDNTLTARLLDLITRSKIL